MNRAFLAARIAATQAEIIALEDALLALATNQIQSYTFDSGQTRQVVTRLNLTELRKAVDSLYNRCATLEARLTGGNVVTVRPLW